MAWFLTNWYDMIHVILMTKLLQGEILGIEYVLCVYFSY